MNCYEEMYCQIAVLGQTGEYSLWYNISKKKEQLGLYIWTFPVNLYLSES